jgi:diadenosine tetraphosphatase ApaH/serine/threonine PP2A family protein phosphatase
VGQPRDGDPRAAYALIVADRILLHRVSYDIDATVAAMKHVGYEAFCYENLYMGAQIGGRIDRVKVVT